jgi:hypothetical protein
MAMYKELIIVPSSTNKQNLPHVADVTAVAMAVISLPNNEGFQHTKRCHIVDNSTWNRSMHNFSFQTSFQPD